MSRGLQKPILVMAGGTGGHVFPALAVAECLRQRGENIIWLGTQNGIEARVVPAADFAIEWLSVQGLRGKGMATLLLAPFRLLRACWQALWLLRRLRPKAVLGMGGFVSGPGGLMAWLLNIPLFLHEQNSIVGLTKPRSECIGNPVRADLASIEPPETRLQSRINAPLQLLVIGGSLGAAALNSIVPRATACLDRDQRPVIRHQCGDKHLQVCQQNYQQAGVDAEVVSFIDDMQQAYAWADLVVCRAGALTISELTAVGLGSLLIPFPYAVDNHQFHNARFLEQANAAQILNEAELSAESLALKLTFFQQNRPVLVEMAVNARARFQASADEKLAAAIVAGATS
jgi:UDP-N-acetylglucosamine--N-acetylmuramyl-(pentapeptide) pyrophosphoryl-undecaprenol N-acetylglucosamine transferase